MVKQGGSLLGKAFRTVLEGSGLLISSCHRNQSEYYDINMTLRSTYIENSWQSMTRIGRFKTGTFHIAICDAFCLGSQIYVGSA